MAMVQVDLSEYDMLREAKNKAEKEVKELKEEIKEYQKKARVIVTTKYSAIGFDKARMRGVILDTYRRTGSLSEAVEAGIANSFCRAGYGSMDGTLPSTIIDSSSQIVGFEDVRIQVEEKLSKEYKEELENKIREYKHSIKEYDKKYASLDKDYHEAHKKEVDELNKAHEREIQKLNDEHEALVKSLQNKIDTLNEIIESDKETINDLRKSDKEKIAELEATIKEAEAKLRDIAGVKKGFFNKIFG